MRGLFPFQIAVIFALCVWLGVRWFTADALPDWRRGELIMVVLDADMDMDSAFGADIANQFAKHLNVHLRLLKQRPDTAVEFLTTHQAHLAVGLRISSPTALRYSTSYHTLEERVVCAGGAHRKLIPDYLYDHAVAVAANSPQEVALRELRISHDKLKWTAVSDSSPAKLLQSVAEGTQECTIANEEQIATMRNFYPDLSEGVSLGSPSRMAWAIAADGDDTLLEEVNRYIEQIRQDGTLRHLIDRHYGHNERLDTIDAAAFIADSRTLLPHYKPWFVEAGELTGIDWRLLAALAYRESHWNPNATSYTNVRGFMMLTEATADRMGVEDRLDAHASILAGARYLQLLKEQLPLRITEQDRLWMALAAYNQGMGHLEDARILTAKTGLNPDVWADVKRVMPLLSRPAYFRNTRFGEARGGEAVVLVETVRLYYDMLKLLSKPRNRLSLYETPQRLLSIVQRRLGMQKPD